MNESVLKVHVWRNHILRIDSVAFWLCMYVDFSNTALQNGVQPKTAWLTDPLCEYNRQW